VLNVLYHSNGVNICNSADRLEIVAQVGTVDGAKEAISNGADFVICQGIEAGGHVQSTTKLSILLPQVLECANTTPVIAAGGLADKDDVKRMIHEGAAAVMLGTRFVTTQESDAHPMKAFAISDVSDWCLYAGLGCDKINDVPSVSELIHHHRNRHRILAA
jgi:NAD(P)H-dependent flavin oxidoreductase YrpB (nitropropane dioxygenase family)